MWVCYFCFYAFSYQKLPLMSQNNIVLSTALEKKVRFRAHMKTETIEPTLFLVQVVLFSKRECDLHALKRYYLEVITRFQGPRWDRGIHIKKSTVKEILRSWQPRDFLQGKTSMSKKLHEMNLDYWLPVYAYWYQKYSAVQQFFLKLLDTLKNLLIESHSICFLFMQNSFWRFWGAFGAQFSMGMPPKNSAPKTTQKWDLL